MSYTIFFSLALSLIAFLPAVSYSKEYRITATGMSMASVAADVDGNLEPGFTSHEAGVGSFGKFTQTTVGDTVFTGFCDDNVVEVSHIAVSSILRTQNGDLLYRKLRTGTESRVCFDLASEVGSFTAHFDIVGGTGRFQGATGTAIQTGTATPIGAQAGIKLSEVGNIRLAHRGNQGQRSKRKRHD